MDMFYARDIGADGMKVYTKDFIKTDKDLELLGHTFQAPRLQYDIKNWKREGEKLAEQYMKEISHVLGILEKRYAGKYGL